MRWAEAVISAKPLAVTGLVAKVVAVVFSTYLVDK
jgi:hypothetical protein